MGDFIRIALNTGMRRGEILWLEWRWVDLGQGLICLEARHSKGRRRRSVPINNQAHEAFINRARFRSKHCPDSPWVFCDKAGRRIQDVKKGFAAACRKAGIGDFGIHDMRHTCASWLVMAGEPLANVHNLLGHRSISQTERYAHLAPDQIRQTASVLDSRFTHGRPSGEDMGGL